MMNVGEIWEDFAGEEREVVFEGVCVD